MKFFLLSAFTLMFMSAAANANEVQLPSQQRTLPDGSTEMHFSQSDGSRIKQVHKPDGSIEISSLDGKNKGTVMVQHPDGTIEFKPKSMS